MQQDETEADAISDRQHAEKLCKEIRRYWRKRGSTVEVWPVSVFDPHRHTIWAVRSNMVGGRPVRGDGKEKAPHGAGLPK